MGPPKSSRGSSAERTGEVNDTRKPSPGAPQRTPSTSSLHKISHGHRQSFADNLRNAPASPRSQRHPSVSHSTLQDLLNHPPASRSQDARFSGRDWRDITVGELVFKDVVKWVTLDSSVEEATMMLLKSTASNVVLVREHESANRAASTFDFNDLNAYLLVVVGLARPGEELVDLHDRVVKKAQAQEPIPLREVQPLFRKEMLKTMVRDEDLSRVMEVFGSGIHRVLVTNEAGDVVGVLSQLKLLEFFWNEGVNFKAIDELYPKMLHDLGIGSKQIIAVSAESPLADALSLMNNEGLSSVAVVDNASNVLGNISTADVRLLTNTTSLPLLEGTCLQFISVILNERGVEQGKDSVPVFYVNPYSTLAHTVAKLVATRSQRMWVVESGSPAPSGTATPLHQPPTVVLPATNANPSSSLGHGAYFSSVPTSAMPGTIPSGHLTGVITLTDVLNLFAKSSGLHPSDPSEQRARRRKSSSSSIRPSLDVSRPSIDARR